MALQLHHKPYTPVRLTVGDLEVVQGKASNKFGAIRLTAQGPFTHWAAQVLVLQIVT